MHTVTVATPDGEEAVVDVPQVLSGLLVGMDEERVYISHVDGTYTAVSRETIAFMSTLPPPPQEERGVSH